MEERLAGEEKLICFCNLGICESQLFLHPMRMLNLYLKGCGLLSHATAKKSKSFLPAGKVSSERGNRTHAEVSRGPYRHTMPDTRGVVEASWGVVQLWAEKVGKTCFQNLHRSAKFS